MRFFSRVTRRSASSLLIISIISLALLAGARGTSRAASTFLNHTTKLSVPLAGSRQVCGAWSVVSSPNVGTYYTILNGVAAITTNDIWAVGVSDTNTALQTVIEHWNGTNWNVIPSPNVGTYSNTLNAVAALSTTDVWAVGNYYTSSNNGQTLNGHTLIEHWDGTSWSVVASPDVGTVDNILRGIAWVPSSNELWAVGYDYDSKNIAHTLIEHWDRTSWSVVASPDVGTTESILNGVVAVSANNIWAVGSYSNTNTVGSILTEHWDGTQWSAVPSPNRGIQSPKSVNSLAGVIAISIHNAWAIGYSQTSNGVTPTKTLVEHWDGTKWSIVASPNPGLGGFLYAMVQLPVSRQLWAVGAYTPSSGGYQTLTEVHCQ